MPTFQIRCAECRELEWPTLPERPSRYVCALCGMLPPEQLRARRERVAKATETRARRKSGAQDFDEAARCPTCDQPLPEGT